MDIMELLRGHDESEFNGENLRYHLTNKTVFF